MPDKVGTGLTGLERAHALAKARREAGEVLIRRDPLQKARAKPTSLRLAVSAKCYDCVGQDQDPGFRARIRDCTVTLCPLHPVRPYQRGDAEDSETSAETSAETSTKGELCDEETS